jgi:hypothetical protein
MYPSYTFIYHSIPSYDGIYEYMSGYQVGRIPGARIPDASILSHGVQHHDLNHWSVLKITPEPIANLKWPASASEVYGTRQFNYLTESGSG